MADIQALHQRASEFLYNGNTQKAIEVYNQIIQENPMDEAALSQLMDIYLETDKFKYYLARANVNIAQGKLDHAISDTKKAINLDPASVEANIKLARLYKVAKKNLKAIDQFNRVIEVDSKDADAYVELINLYVVEDSIQSAISIALRAVEEFEGDYFKNILAKLYLDDGNCEKALEYVTDPMLEAKVLLQNGDNDAAKTKLDTINPNTLVKDAKPAYYMLLAQYFYNKKMHKDAIGAIDSYVSSKEPDAVSFQMRALVCEDKEDAFGASLNWGFCNKFQGKPEEAIMHFVEAHRADSSHKDTLHELIGLYEKLGDKFVAMEYWQKIYEIDEDEEAKGKLADFYYSQGDLNLARKYGKEIDSKATSAPEEDEGILNKIMKLFKK